MGTAFYQESKCKQFQAFLLETTQDNKSMTVFGYRVSYSQVKELKGMSYGFSGSVAINGQAFEVKDHYKNFTTFIPCQALAFKASLTVGSFSKYYVVKKSSVIFFRKTPEGIREFNAKSFIEGVSYFALLESSELESFECKFKDCAYFQEVENAIVPEGRILVSFVYYERKELTEYNCAKAKDKKREALSLFIKDLGEIAKRVGYELLTTDVRHTIFYIDNKYAYVPAVRTAQSEKGIVFECRFPIEWLKKTAMSGNNNHRAFGYEVASIHELPFGVVTKFEKSRVVPVFWLHETVY